MKRTLPVIENGLVDLTDIRIASPCDADWDLMKGDDKIRFCEDCKLNVHDFTAMTHEEVSEILTVSEGRVCGTLFMRPDGTFLIEDCPVGLAQKAMVVTKRSALRMAGLSLTLVLLASLFLSTQFRSSADMTTWEDRLVEKIEHIDARIQKLLRGNRSVRGTIR